MIVKCFSILCQNFICGFRSRLYSSDVPLRSGFNKVKKWTAFKFWCTTMNSAVMIYRGKLYFAMFMRQILLFSVRIDKLLNKFAALLFQKREIK